MRTIEFIFRKKNPGNFSIEKVYHTIISELESNPEFEYETSQKVLNRNYDWKAFFKAFLSSIFKRKTAIHVTGACNYMILAHPFQKRILTIHDLFLYKKYPGIKGKLYDLFFLDIPGRFAHHIVAISQQTKDEIVSFHPKFEKKMSILHNPLVIPQEYVQVRKRSLTADAPMRILQIGDKALKNYERLLEATHDMNVTYTFIHGDRSKIDALIEKFGLQQRATVYNRITDQELYAAYNDCDVLFFASEAEGFGLPILEAQAFGMPVVTANLPPMSVIGKDTIMVDPFSVAAIKDGFQQLYDSALLERMLAKGFENVAQFSPEAVAMNYLKFYKEQL